MSDPAAVKLKRMLDGSGFPFQLALEAAVRSLQESTGWRVTGREYPWRTASASGYMDLVLSDETTHLAIECKRSRDAKWMFLMSDEKQRERSHAEVCWTDTKPNRPPLTGWGNIQVYPSSPESEFCVIRGQDEKGKPLLERLASSVTEAANGLAMAFLELGTESSASNVILPVIVTNADLVVGTFDPSDVDLQTGKVESAEFESVPHLRFRKSLADSAAPDEYDPESLDDLASASVRTVFVVQGSALPEWLKNFQKSATDQSSPWVNARQVEDAMSGLL